MLDRALEKAEAKESRQQSCSRPPINFEHGGTNIQARKELVEQPTLRTSKATNTGEEDEGGGPPVIVQPRPKRCEIPLDYNRINRMQLEGYLTRPAVFDMTRLYLAYLSRNKDKHYEGETFVSAKVKLRAMGFPEDIEKVMELYLSFCRSQGVCNEDAIKDLQTLESHISGKKMSQFYAERSRREAVERAYENMPTACDPECVLL